MRFACLTRHEIGAFSDNDPIQSMRVHKSIGANYVYASPCPIQCSTNGFLLGLLVLFGSAIDSGRKRAGLTTPKKVRVSLLCLVLVWYSGSVTGRSSSGKSGRICWCRIVVVRSGVVVML